MRVVLCAAFALLLSASTGQAADFLFEVRQVDDSRTTGEHFARCQVKIAAIGPFVEKANQVRMEILDAKDDTGRSLKKDPGQSFKSGAEFEKIRKDKPDEVIVDVELANPARSAKVISELKGRLHLYSAASDPAAEIKAPIAKSDGKPLAAPALKAAGVHFSILNKAQYEAFAKAKAEEQKKAGDASLGEAVAKGFANLFGGMNPGPSDIILSVEDPNKKLVGYELQDSKGAAVQTGWTMTQNNVKVIHFDATPPPDCQVVIWLASPAALKSEEFTLTNVRLP